MTPKTLVALRSLINDRLKELLPKREGIEFLLFEGAHYSLMLPAKRLRPLFFLNGLKDYSIPLAKGIDIACAIEMIHTYSLIHDDLPCMDDDDLRRGKPSLHKVYGEAQAVLVGDFLLTYAFEVLASCGAPREVVQTIAKASGGHGMIGGQLVDILFEGKEIDWDILKFMYLGKTAALFAASLECAAIISNAPLNERNGLKQCGEYFGIAFQMEDDILNVTSDIKTLGKPIGTDKKKNKSNCISLFGKEKAVGLAKEYKKKAIDVLPSHCQNIYHLIEV